MISKIKKYLAYVMVWGMLIATIVSWLLPVPLAIMLQSPGLALIMIVAPFITILTYFLLELLSEYEEWEDWR